MTIEQVAPLVAARKVSPRELVESLLGRIKEDGARLNAFITVDADRARSEAARAEAEILCGRYRGPLHGVPVALKDNIWTAGLRTTAGSKILADFVPVDDATVVRRLRRAGAIVIGKTNMSEFAYGATNNNPHYGADAQPVGSGAHHGRLERRVRRGRGRRVCVRRARHRHRRLRPHSGRTLRRDGAQAHVWPRELPRDDAARAPLRPRGPDRAQRHATLRSCSNDRRA